MIFDSKFLFVVNYELQDWSKELNKVVNSAYETRVATLISQYQWKSVDLICSVKSGNCVEIADVVDRDDILVLCHRYDSKRARKRIIERIGGKFPINAHWIKEYSDECEFESKRIENFKVPSIEEGFLKVKEHKHEV